MKRYRVSILLLCAALIVIMIITNQQNNMSTFGKATILFLILIAIILFGVVPAIKFYWKHHRDCKLSRTLKKSKTWKT
jgi:membrane protein YdbS with pleckstrin-like domain